MQTLRIFLLILLPCITKLHGQTDTIYKKGYVIVETEQDDNPGLFIFVEKNILPRDNTKPVHQVFDPATDTAVLTHLVFIEESAKLKMKKFTTHSLKENLSSQLKFFHDGIPTTTTKKFKIIPALLKFVIPQSSFSMQDDYTSTRLFTDDKRRTILKFSRMHNSGWVSNFYRYYYFDPATGTP